MLTFTFLVTASAQRPGPSDAADRAQIRERMERMFVAYLTAELDIGVEMGQQFWPVYNEFSGPIHAADSTVHVSRRELSLAGGELWGSNYLPRPLSLFCVLIAVAARMNIKGTNVSFGANPHSIGRMDDEAE